MKTTNTEVTEPKPSLIEENAQIDDQMPKPGAAK